MKIGEILKKENVVIAVAVFIMIVQSNYFATKLDLAQLKNEMLQMKIELKKYAEAESSFRKSLAMLPSGTEDPLTYYNLSTVLFEQGKADDALSYAKKAYETKDALRDSNSKANVTYNYALLCEKTSRVEEAIAKYNVGDKINVYVVDVKPGRQQIKLSIKEFKKKMQREEISQYMSSNDDAGDSAYTLGSVINKNA